MSISFILLIKVLSYFSLDKTSKAKVEIPEAKVVDEAKHGSGSGEEAKMREGDTMKVKVKEGEMERMKVKEVEVERSSGHRVTFNDQNEVASQDRDGTFKVRLEFWICKRSWPQILGKFEI